MEGKLPYSVWDVIRYAFEVIVNTRPHHLIDCLTNSSYILITQSCESLLNDAETKSLLNRHFDLVILDGAFPECAVGLAYTFRVPFMYINTVGFYTGSLSLAGNPAPYSITPVFFSSFTDDMNLYQRLLNTVYTMFAFTVHRVSKEREKATKFYLPFNHP